MRGRTIRVFLAVVLLLCVAAGFRYVFFPPDPNSGADLRLTDTGWGVAYDFDGCAQFHSFDSRFFYFCTRDGVKYLSSGGDAKWTKIINMARPHMTGCGETVAVGEESRAKNVYVFKPAGLLYEAELSDPAQFFSVNASGYLSVIMQIDKGYAVEVFEPKGRGGYFKSYIYDALIFPTAAHVSDDGRYVAVADLSLEVRMKARIAFYDTSMINSSFTEEGMLYREEYPEQIISCVRFMDGGRVFIFTDLQVACYRLGDGAVEMIWAIPLHNKVDKLCFYGGKRFALAFGDKLLNHDGAEDPGVVYIVNTDGEITGRFAAGRKVTSLSMSRDAAMVGLDRCYTALDMRGNVLWEHVALQDTKQMIFLDNTDTVLFAASGNATVMRRAKPKAEPLLDPAEGGR